MAKQIKMVNEDIIEPNLLSKILGYNNVTQKEFVDQVNSRLTMLDNKKQDSADMNEYFSKSDSVPKANLDQAYVQQLDALLAHKIEFADLGSTLSSRISGYENDAREATSNVKNLNALVTNMDAGLSNAKTDISNIYNQLATLQTFSTTGGGNGGSDENNTNVQNQITSLTNRVTSLDNTINAMSAQLAGFATQDDVINMQTSVSTLTKKVNGINVDPPAGVQGESVILGNNAFVASRMLLTGRIINGKGNDQAPTTCEAEIAKNAQDSYFDFANNIAYVLKTSSSGDSYYEKWMDPAITSTKQLNGSTYAVVQNAFTTWFGNNKFIIDYSTGIFGISVDGEYTEVSRSTTTTSLERLTTDLNAANEKIVTANNTIADLVARMEAAEANIASLQKNIDNNSKSTATTP